MKTIIIRIDSSTSTASSTRIGLCPITNLERGTKMSRFGAVLSMIIVSREGFQWSNCTGQTSRKRESMTIIETDSNGSMEEMVMKIGEVKGKTVVLAITGQKEAIILNATTVAKIGTAVRTIIEISVTDLHHILLSAVLLLLVSQLP